MMPGDGLIANLTHTATHAVTVDAPARRYLAVAGADRLPAGWVVQLRLARLTVRLP